MKDDKKAAHSDSIHFVTADSTDIPRIRADIFALTGYGINLPSGQPFAPQVQECGLY